jgi:outer membrane murein-binding lipoprotein Lpp
MPGTYDHRTDRELLLDLLKKVDKMSAAIEALTAAVAELEADETAAAAEFATLATEIGELKAGEISEAEVDSLAEKAAAVAAALKAATPSGTE